MQCVDVQMQSERAQHLNISCFVNTTLPSASDEWVDVYVDVDVDVDVPKLFMFFLL